jgi:predicted nucleotidyltransferase
MPTALELSHEGWQGYLKRAGRKLEHHVRPAANQQERDRLLALVRQAAQVLKTRFGAKRVILLGSMVRPDRFTPQSDVDVVVAGLRADAYWETWRVVEEIVQDRPVDLIDLDGASESMRRSVERYGIDL